MVETESWVHTCDGFSLCLQPLSELLERRGIYDTGLSPINPRDVESYFDDWHFFRVGEHWGLCKLREQERDYIPGYSDGDNAGVTVSFVGMDEKTYLALCREDTPESRPMQEFLQAFRRVTEFRGQPFDPALQAYFSRAESEGPYVIADAYIRKLAALCENGCLAFPDSMTHPPVRLVRGLERYNREAGRIVCDFGARCLRIADSHALTREERLCILAVHAGNLTENSFAAEVQFHALALKTWHNRIPFGGKHWWYASAIRADMQVERDDPLRKLLFTDYYRESSHLMQKQIAMHGRK